MELRQSSLVSSMLPSNQTRWKFWISRALSSRRGVVLEDVVVDFVSVALIDVVEQVKMLFFISNVGMVFLYFFFSHSRVQSDSVAFSITQKTKLLRRNSLTTKERQKPEQNNTIHRFSCFNLCWHLKCFSISFSASVVTIVECVKVKLGRTHIKAKIKKRLFLPLSRCAYVPSCYSHIKIKEILLCWFWIHPQRTNEEKHPDQQTYFKNMRLIRE
jgi:hypothetical protein